MAGHHGEITVTPGQPDTSTYLRTSRLTRCANRPSKQRVADPYRMDSARSAWENLTPDRASEGEQTWRPLQ